MGRVERGQAGAGAGLTRGGARLAGWPEQWRDQTRQAGAAQEERVAHVHKHVPKKVFPAHGVVAALRGRQVGVRLHADEGEVRGGAHQRAQAARSQAAHRLLPQRQRLRQGEEGASGGSAQLLPPLCWPCLRARTRRPQAAQRVALKPNQSAGEVAPMPNPNTFHRIPRRPPDLATVTPRP